jgi:urea transport system permease protein
MFDPAFLAGQVFNGLSVGSIYLLAGLGLALSFGLMRVINMAHGEIIMFGGYIAYLEVGLISRLSSRPLDTLLATWGVSLIAQQAARDIFGATGVSVTAPSWLDGVVAFGGMSLPFTRLFIILIAALVLGGLAVFLKTTRAGLLVRAVNQDRPTASAMGVDVRSVDMLIFALGAAVAGVGGVILALIGPVTPNVGQGYIVTAFLVVIMGGLGSITGTAIAAVILGLVSSLAQVFVDVSFAQVLMLVFVVAFLQFRPQGVIAVRSRALDA